MLRADLISKNCSEAMRPILLCQIGHLHLLLREYSEGKKMLVTLNSRKSVGIQEICMQQ